MFSISMCGGACHRRKASGLLTITSFILSGRGNSHLNNQHQLQHQRHNNKIKLEKQEEEEDEEGIDQPDSLYCSESLEEDDALMEFRRKIESDA